SASLEQLMMVIAVACTMRCEGPAVERDGSTVALQPVPKGDPCKGVTCPPGTVCVPGMGRCGIPIGGDCYDLGSAWWTGRDNQDLAPGETHAPTPSTFVLINDGAAPLYLRSILNKPARFDVLLSQGDSLRQLALPENLFCPTPCPAQGPVMEVDCGAPPRGMYRLMPGARIELQWMGRELARAQRICAEHVQYCYTGHNTVPGRYIVEVCSYAAATQGTPRPKNPDQLDDAEPVGVPACEQVAFDHPAAEPVEVHLGH
ncbi:MAG TPA: hypothetical protein VKG92_11275, partial [Flavobacteriales bacterium]|nr:hypothetical protein [Flavobacteriales bacterium]